MPLSSVAEELAANAIIESAKVYAETTELDVVDVLEDFKGVYFEDTDSASLCGLGGAFTNLLFKI